MSEKPTYEQFLTIFIPKLRELSLVAPERKPWPPSEVSPELRKIIIEQDIPPSIRIESFRGSISWRRRQAVLIPEDFCPWPRTVTTVDPSPRMKADAVILLMQMLKHVTTVDPSPRMKAEPPAPLSEKEEKAKKEIETIRERLTTEAGYVEITVGDFRDLFNSCMNGSQPKHLREAIESLLKKTSFFFPFEEDDHEKRKQRIDGVVLAWECAMDELQIWITQRSSDSDDLLSGNSGAVATAQRVVRRGRKPKSNVEKRHQVVRDFFLSRTHITKSKFFESEKHHSTIQPLLEDLHQSEVQLPTGRDDVPLYPGCANWPDLLEPANKKYLKKAIPLLWDARWERSRQRKSQAD